MFSCQHRFCEEDQHWRERVEKDGRIDADSILPGRLEAYTGMQTGDTGLPNERRKDLSVRPYFTDGPPRLTWRQAQFYGLVPYAEGNRTRAEIRASAEARCSLFRLRVSFIFTFKLH